MKRFLLSLYVLIFSLPAFSQNYLGMFEVGENIPFLVIASDPVTGSPTNPVNLSYSVMQFGAALSSGSMSIAQLGVATGSYSTSGDSPGQYDILISGLIGGVTAQAYKTYSLYSAGHGITGIANEVSGLGGLTPLTEAAYLPYKNEMVACVTASVLSASQAIIATIDDMNNEVRIGSREYSRARLWYAQSAIDSSMRKVPADLPSHIEIQLAAPDDILFATPIETFFRVLYYSNASSAVKSSKEIRSTTPPIDGTFYLSPNQSW